MELVQNVVEFMEAFAPSGLAEDWDNVGLLIGRSQAPLEKVMTCLTVTPASVQEAINRQAQLVVSHHPFPFRPFKQVTDGSVEGRLMLRLIEAKIAVYSPHTAFDSAAQGINQRLAEGLGLEGIEPIVEHSDGSPSSLAEGRVGAGRLGHLSMPLPLAELGQRLKGLLKVKGLYQVGCRGEQRLAKRVAVACGSGGSLLQLSLRRGCDVFITGEASFHTCLAAQAAGIRMILPGHFASERFAVEELAHHLGDRFPGLKVWACQDEVDPLTWV